MSLDDHLIHTCTIENPGSGSTNAYNNKTKAYTTPLTGVRCRLIEDREEVKTDEITEGTIRTVYRLMVRSDVDLQEKAKVSSVTLEDGTVINDVFEIDSVLVRRGRNAHHKTATLERIS
jgi:hypothetical protein